MFKQRLKLHIYKIQIFKCVKSLYATQKKTSTNNKELKNKKIILIGDMKKQTF